MTFLPVVLVLRDEQLLELALELGPALLLLLELAPEVVTHVGIGLGREHLVRVGQVRLGAPVVPVRIDDGTKRRDATARLRGRALVTRGVQLGKLRLELFELGLEVDQTFEHEPRLRALGSRSRTGVSRRRRS